MLTLLYVCKSPTFYFGRVVCCLFVLEGGEYRNRSVAAGYGGRSKAKLGARIQLLNGAIVYVLRAVAVSSPAI